MPQAVVLELVGEKSPFTPPAMPTASSLPCFPG